MRSRYQIGMVLLMLILLTACGTRGIPVIGQEQLNGKLAVLMITAAGLTDSTKQTIDATLHGWRESEKITFEWLKDIKELDEGLLAKIRSRTYDYIFVVGNSLYEASAKEAVLDKNSKWTLLQEAWGTDISPASLESAAWRHLDVAHTDLLKDEWVKQQMKENVSLEWVTRAANPIPSAWAPSEEADHIVMLDQNEQWQQQLIYQIREHNSKWIVFYTAADQATLQKAKNIGIPVKDLTVFSAYLNWETILASQLAIMKQNSWKPGSHVYSGQEVKELKIK